MYKKQQTIENEFHVAMSAEKSTPASTSSIKISSPSTSTSTTLQDEPQQQPSKPPRQKSKAASQIQSTSIETTIDNLDIVDDHNDVSDGNSKYQNRACGQLTQKQLMSV